MSRTEAELAVSQLEEYARTPQEILEGLAANMRAFDKFSARLAELEDSRRPLVSRLDRVRAVSDASILPVETAYDALNLHLINNRINELSSDLEAYKDDMMGWFILKLGGFESTKISVESTDPEKYRLGTLIRNSAGHLDGMSRYPHSRKGKVSDLNLDPQYGGFLHFEGSVYTYQASPLIDRENDYKPAFEIKLA